MSQQPNVGQILAVAAAYAIGIAGAIICAVVAAAAIVAGGVGVAMILGATELHGRVAR